jgi:hypothetical protein
MRAWSRGHASFELRRRKCAASTPRHDDGAGPGDRLRSLHVAVRRPYSVIEIVYVWLTTCASGSHWS